MTRLVIHDFYKKHSRFSALNKEIEALYEACANAGRLAVPDRDLNGLLGPSEGAGI